MKAGRGWISISAGVALALVPAACRAGDKEKSMQEAAHGKTERRNVGRLSIELPAGMRRFGDRYDLRLLELREVELTPPLDGAWKRTWAVKLAEIEALKAERDRPNQLIGEVRSQRELEPGRLAMVVYHGDNSRLGVTYLALRGAGERGLWLERPGGVEDEDEIRRTIVTVSGAYASTLPGKVTGPGEDVFHLAHGVIRLPFEEHEEASATFEGGPLSVEVELSTETTDEPERGGLVERFGEAVARAGAEYTAGLSPVRSGKRAVAGMTGEEFVLRDAEGGRLAFVWKYPGEARSATRPEIVVQMITADERQKEKTAFWDALLASLRPAAAP